MGHRTAVCPPPCRSGFRCCQVSVDQDEEWGTPDRALRNTTVLLSTIRDETRSGRVGEASLEEKLRKSSLCQTVHSGPAGSLDKRIWNWTEDVWIKWIQVVFVSFLTLDLKVSSTETSDFLFWFHLLFHILTFLVFFFFAFVWKRPEFRSSLVFRRLRLTSCFLLRRGFPLQIQQRPLLSWLPPGHGGVPRRPRLRGHTHTAVGRLPGRPGPVRRRLARRPVGPVRPDAVLHPESALTWQSLIKTLSRSQVSNHAAAPGLWGRPDEPPRREDVRRPRRHRGIRRLLFHRASERWFFWYLSPESQMCFVTSLFVFYYYGRTKQEVNSSFAQRRVKNDIIFNFINNILLIRCVFK